MKVQYSTGRMFAFLVCWFKLTVSLAHPMPPSSIQLKVGAESLRGIARIPLPELMTIWNVLPNTSSEVLFREKMPEFTSQFLREVNFLTLDQKKWPLRITQQALTRVHQEGIGRIEVWEVYFETKPPPHYELRNFFLHVQLINHQVASHQWIVHIQHDFENGTIGHDNHLQMGIIENKPNTTTTQSLFIDLGEGSVWTGFFAMVQFGVWHILQGADHLCFLLILVLGVFKTGKWKEQLSQLGLLISVFTLGHALSLGLTLTGRMPFSSYWIEIGVGVTILFSALFGLVYSEKVPLFFPTFIFGLIHGGAFAQTLVDIDLQGTHLFWGVLGFNVGIESVQIALIAAIIPVLKQLTKNKVVYDWIARLTLSMGVVLSIFWIFQRI